MNALPSIDPMPPVAGGALPWIGSAIGLLRNPSAFFNATRRRLGDTFVVDALGYRLFCVFSPLGVKALYAFAEEEASFGRATFTLVFKYKVPLDLVRGRRNRAHDLFGNQEVERYLDTLDNAVRLQLAELGPDGTFEIFAFARRLGHRLGLAAWAGAEAAAPANLDRLIPLFERLDTSDSFVNPARTWLAHVTGKRRERRAMEGIERIVGEILAARTRRGARPDDFLDQIWRSFADLPPGARGVHTARDVMIIHMGAQSNLYAALGWTLVNLLLRPDYLASVRAGDDVLLEQCANESIRLAQRSLTLRQVVRPLTLTDEHRSYHIAPGTLIATMLSANNTSAAPGLEHFDPGHYEGRRLAPHVQLAARELVSTFGHARHSCPAQRFSISAIRIAIRRLLERFDLEPQFHDAEPRPRQLGAVARPARPCVVRYRTRF